MIGFFLLIRPLIFDKEGIKMDSFISWIGGKKLLRKKIIEQFPKEGSYSRYIEVFGGRHLTPLQNT